MDDFADLGLPIELTGPPKCKLTEEYRSKEPDGSEVTIFLGEDGWRYRNTQTPNGQSLWVGFKQDTVD
jgi:hypothetical protein